MAMISLCEDAILEYRIDQAKDHIQIPLAA